MTHKKSKTLVASAVSLALSSMMLSASLNAGVIQNSNFTDPGFLGACGAEGTPTACIGAWDLGNVDVELVKADDIASIIGTFGPATGTYSTMTYGDSFRSYVKDVANTRMARISGKDWPVGEPTGIKAVVGDGGVKNGNPQNCIINTSYLDAADDSNPSTTETSYLDSTHPEPVICSSAFQTHKRFKIAMLDTTVAGTAAGDPGKPIDMVFNVADDATGLRYYQVFSKINNYTGVRLKGYMIQVGKGVGAGFKTASQLGITDRLQISRGIGDYLINPVTIPPTYDPVKNLWNDDQMATYSSGLFGLADKHFPDDGFFDNEPAGFFVSEGCTTNTGLVLGACPVASDTDTLRSNGPLGPTTSFYYTYFGNWPHQNLTPRGVFHDTDDNPTTDADLVAWWNGTQWVKPDNRGTFDPKVVDTTPSVFVPVSETELNAWANDRSCSLNTKSCYSVDVIEDVLNLGLNYVIKVGDGIGDTSIPTNDIVGTDVTVRIIPIVADNPTESGAWVANLPPVGDLLPVSDTPVTPPPTTTTTSDGGGGCAVGGNGRFDPTLPALLAAGLGFFGWRRFRNGK